MSYHKSILFTFLTVFCVAQNDSDVNVTCGMDFSPLTKVYEGVTPVETYPWLGVLYYPLGQTRVTTVVVLVTRQILIASASEIDKVPKNHFRRQSRVVLGRRCTHGPGLRVREYTYHPEFERETYSALALIQLDLDQVEFDLQPICGPPSHFVDMRFYALSLNEDCERQVVMVHEMEYVDDHECRTFYRRSGLDVSSLWPRHVTCARALQGGECVWRGGAALATKIGNRWHLLGFGVYGPGCRAPARFLDYGVYTQWVRASVARIGKPAVTRLAEDHIILRRSLSNLQRFGPCDKEEIKAELFTDEVDYMENENENEEAGRGMRSKLRTIKYNVTIHDTVEYSCVSFRVITRFIDQIKNPKASLRLRRWCAKPNALCHDFRFLEIEFFVEIRFTGSISFHLHAYGRQAKVLDVKNVMKYANGMRTWPDIPDGDVNDTIKMKGFFWDYN